jgi:hypothetical protein
MSKRSRGHAAGTADGMISTDIVVVAAEHQVSAQLGEETMILHFEDGTYYGLDAVGASIWDLLQQPRTVAEIRDRICEDYDVEPGRCERELIVLLRQLTERRLVELPDPVPRA